MIAVCAHQWYALPPILRGRWEIRGKLTCPNGTSPHTWGTILCIIPPISLTNIPYLPVADSVWQGDMGIWMWQSWLSAHPWGKIPMANTLLSPISAPDIYARFSIPLMGALYDNYTVYWQCGEEITIFSDWVARGWLVWIQDFVCYLLQILVTLFCRSDSLSFCPLWSGYRTDLPGWCFLYWYWESTGGLQIHCQP